MVAAVTSSRFPLFLVALNLIGLVFAAFSLVFAYPVLLFAAAAAILATVWDGQLLVERLRDEAPEVLDAYRIRGLWWSQSYWRLAKARDDEVVQESAELRPLADAYYASFALGIVGIASLMAATLWMSG